MGEVRSADGADVRRVAADGVAYRRRSCGGPTVAVVGGVVGG